MKILATADLHAPPDNGPYRRLAASAGLHGCGLVVIAGDLLNLFAGNARKRGRVRQF